MSQDKTSPEKYPSLEHVEESSNSIRRFRRYIAGVHMEMKQVTWPTWKQVRSTTFVVLFFTFAMAVFVAVLDWIGAFLYQLLVTR